MTGVMTCQPPRPLRWPRPCAAGVSAGEGREAQRGRMSCPGHAAEERGAGTPSFLRATPESRPPHPLDQPCCPPRWGPLSPGLAPAPLPEGP